MYVMYRVAYAPGPEDPPERDRTLRDFTAVTGREAERAAREWAASRNQQRPPELREKWPWVLERSMVPPPCSRVLSPCLWKPG